MLLALAPSSLLAPCAPPLRRCGGVRCAAAAGGSPADALRADQDLSLIRRGERERGLLQEGTALEMPRRAAKAAKAGGARGGSAGGFGGAKAPKAKAAGKSKGKRAAVGGAARDAQELADELRREGVVRIDGGLTPATADALAAYVDALRATSAAEVAAGADASSRFADLVLVESRCDLLLPLEGVVVEALQELLGDARGTLGRVIEATMGEEGIFQEVATLVSDPGSQQQPLHPDTPWQRTPPLFACFVALQDVDVEMGPTVFLPRTHTREMQDAFYGAGALNAADRQGVRSNAPVDEAFLKSRPVKLGLLKKGDCALYNQCVLHCGSANKSPDRPRRQFYVSFRDPSCGALDARPSIKPEYKTTDHKAPRLTLGSVRAELRKLAAGERADRFEELVAAGEER